MGHARSVRHSSPPKRRAEHQGTRRTGSPQLGAVRPVPIAANGRPGPGRVGGGFGCASGRHGPSRPLFEPIVDSHWILALHRGTAPFGRYPVLPSAHGEETAAPWVAAPDERHLRGLLLDVAAGMRAKAARHGKECSRGVPNE